MLKGVNLSQLCSKKIDSLTVISLRLIEKKKKKEAQANEESLL